MAKTDKPANFKGIQAMVITDYINDDACIQKGNGYSEGDIVDFFPADHIFSDTEHAERVYDIVYIKDVIMQELELMTQTNRTIDSGYISRRLWKINKQDARVKSKFVWEKADYTATTEKYPSTNVTPPPIVRVG